MASSPYTGSADPVNAATLFNVRNENKADRGVFTQTEATRTKTLTRERLRVRESLGSLGRDAVVSSDSVDKKQLS